MVSEASISCRTPSVQWFGPDDLTDRRRLDAWCAGVGPVVLEDARADGTRELALHGITFVSWNVHVGNGDLVRFVDDLRVGRWTAGHPVFDIVFLLQEVLRRGDVPVLSAGASGAGRIRANNRRGVDIEDVARELGMWLAYAPSMRNGKTVADPSEDRGNAILSTLPLADARAVELPGERQRRVALFARIARGPADHVSVGVLHFDALAARRRFWLFGSSRVRAMQAESLAAVLPEGTLALGADLNTWRGANEPAPKYFRRLFASTAVTIDESGPGHRSLDYMFFRAPGTSARYRVVQDKYGSDHYPLVGWFE